MAFTKVAETGYSGVASMHIYIEYQLLSQNISENRSTVRVQSVMFNAGYSSRSYNASSPGAHLYVNGALVNSASGNFDTDNLFNILNTHDITVNHDSNGNGSFTLRGLHYTDVSLGNGDVSATITLPKINRAATLNSVVFTNDEANPVFNVTNNGTNWMTFWIEFGPIGGTAETIYITHSDVAGITNTYTMVLTSQQRELLWQRATENTIRVRMGIRTNIGGVMSDPVFTDITVPVVNANPTFSGTSVTITDALASTVALTGDSTKIIPNYSNMKVTIPVASKAVGVKNATIVKYRMWISGSAYVDVPEIADTILTKTFLPNNAYIIYIQAIDSRGNSTTISKTATVLAYVPPTLTSFSLIRSGGGTGTTITSAITGTLWRLTFGAVMNAVTFTWMYRLVGTTTWTTGSTTITPTYNGNTFTSASGFGTFSASYSYEVQLTVADKLSTAVINSTIVIARPAIKILGNSAIVPDSTFKLESDTGVRKPILDYACPVGLIAYFARATPPSGWLKCNGALVSRTTYAALFEVIGLLVNSNPGETVFQLPDLRGEFIRGWDDGRGKDQGRVLGAGQGDEVRLHLHSLPGTVWSDSPGSDTKFINPSSSGSNWFNTETVGGRSKIFVDNYGGTETRPTNGAWLACIKYL